MKTLRAIFVSVMALTSYRTSIAWMPSSSLSQGAASRIHHGRLIPSRQAFSPLASSNTIEVVTSSSAFDEKEHMITPSPPEPPADESGLSVEQKVLNALFLSAAFGYAIYTILNVDAGMTRGWTASEIAMRIPLDNWGSYESYLASKPVFTKTLINVIIYLLGDWLSQTVFQGKNVLEFDLPRTLRNGFIGLCFGPLVHEYYQFSDSILPPENGMVTRLEKILMDQTIYLTVKCSIYISAVGLLGGDDWPTVKENVKSKIGGVVLTAWKFWPLVHCITYGLIPARHRILWVNSVDLVWNAILATQAQKASPEDEEKAAAAAEQGMVLLAEDLDEEGKSMLETENWNSTTPILVLDNKWVEDQKDAVAEMLNPSTPSGTNVTSDAVPAS